MNSRIAYFDNAATTFPKPGVVYDFADDFYRNSGGNIGRGGNALAVASGQVARQAKENLRRLYGCPTREVVFTPSATDALNRILLGADFQAGAHVYISPFEHNAVTRPLHYLAKSRDIEIHVLPFDESTLEPDMDAIEKAFDRAVPSIVVLTHASNVCGAVIPVLDILSLAKRYDATTVVDMSQTAGLLDLDLAKTSIDFAVFAGHKTLLAPFGIGGFFCQRGVRLNPVFFGGNGVNSIEQELPSNITQMIEIGSQNTYAIAGLKASTEWILERGMRSLHEIEAELRGGLVDILDRHGARIVAREMSCDRIGVVSATFEEYAPDEMEMVLGRFNVAVRSGIQCAPYAHRFLGTLPSGTVRFSVSALTTQSDLEFLDSAMDSIASEY